MQEKIINEILVKHITEGKEFKDSLEIGTSKTGIIKVYCNFDNKEETKLYIVQLVRL